VLRGLPHLVLPRAALDVADAAAVRAAIGRARPWAVVNAAGFSRVDGAEADPARCRRENVEAAAVLAEACAAAGLPLVAFSSHLVFGAERDDAWTEEDAPAPGGVYASDKAEAEGLLLSRHPDTLLVRCGAFFGPWDMRNELSRAVREVRRGREVAAAADVILSPTYLPDLAEAVLDLLMDRESGTWHLANAGAASWSDVVRETVGGLALDRRRVRPVPRAELPWRAPRPRQSALRSRRGLIMPPLDRAIGCYVATLREGRAEAQQGVWLTRCCPPG
jgi:dTDP-4-dehydrorhamnose reductase